MTFSFANSFSLHISAPSTFTFFAPDSSKNEKKLIKKKKKDKMLLSSGSEEFPQEIREH